MRLPSSRWVLAAGLVAGGFVMYQSRSDLQQWVRKHQFRFEGLETAVPAEVYFLETNRWLEFKIPKASPLARLISNASIAPETAAAEGVEWPYAIRYQLVGEHGRTNLTGVYHLKGQHLVYTDKESGRVIEVNSFLDRSFQPLGARNWMINFNDVAITNSRLLRLCLESMHPSLREVGVRVYFRAETAPRKLSYLWNRLSEEQKRDLARGNVYSFIGLTERERTCLLRYHWAVASAEGIPGRDFTRRTLFARDDTENLQLLKDWVPAGVPADPEHYAVLPVTNTAGACELHLAGDAAAGTSAVISNSLLWHGDLQRRIETNYLVWSGSNHVLLPPRSEGLLQIHSSHPVYVRALQVQSGETNDITPAPTHLLTFSCSPTNSVEYEVEHVGEQPSLFRLELRRVPSFLPCPGPSVVIANYELLSELRQSLKSGEVVLTNELSRYDWLVTTNGLTNITVAQSLYFVLPVAVRALRVSSSAEPILVNAYTRPPDLVKKVRVPDDYASTTTLSPTQPSWFTVRPPDQAMRRERGQTSVIRVQPRLPENDPLIEAGQYEWESFLPQADPRGRMLLLPPAEGRPQRPGSLSFSYFPVALGCTQRVRFQSEPWEKRVKPSLLLIRTNGAPGVAHVTLAGKTVFDNQVEAAVAEVSLGEVEPGENELCVIASTAMRAYLNCVESTNTAAYLQRFCLAASSNALSFPYLKRDANSELLVARIFSPATTNPEPFEVHVNLKSSMPREIGPFSALTFMEREVTVTPGPRGRACLVGAVAPQLDEGQPLFLPIGPDVPPAAYELQLRVKAASPRWLSLSRTTPGMAEKLSVLLQMREN